MAIVVHLRIEKVIGEDTNRASRTAGGLVEQSAASGAGTHHGWQRDLTAATLSEHPGVRESVAAGVVVNLNRAGSMRHCDEVWSGGGGGRSWL